MHVALAILHTQSVRENLSRMSKAESTRSYRTELFVNPIKTIETYSVYFAGPLLANEGSKPRYILIVVRH